MAKAPTTNPKKRSAHEKTMIAYEQPMGERIRSFLRFEYLFDRAHNEINKQDTWSHRTALECLFDVMSLMGASDIKKEIIKELKRHSGTLKALAKHPDVDQTRLENLESEIHYFLNTINIRDSAPGYELKFHEFLSTVRQRSNLPAGACDFDAPNLHFWLQNTPAHRAADLSGWFRSFDIIHHSIALCLNVIRESVKHSKHVAENGFFQLSLLPDLPCQIIQVCVDPYLNVYPEISAGKHRITIRFMMIENSANRPTQTDQNISFRLGLCAI